jgi:hypothetical protein
VPCLFAKETWEGTITFPAHFVGVSFAQKVVGTGLVRPPTAIASSCITGEGAHIGNVTQFVAFTTLGENGGISQSYKLATFSKHPDTFFPSFLSDFAGMIHVGEDYRGIFSQVMGGAGIVRHLGDGNVSQDAVVPHFFDEDIGACNVLLVVGGSDMLELGPHPIAGCDNGANLEVLQENVLELDHLFVGDVACRGEIEVAVSLLIAFLVQLGDPPATDQDDSVLR